MEKITCSQLRLKLAEIKDLKKEFDLEVGKIRETRNAELLNGLKNTISEKMIEFHEPLFNQKIVTREKKSLKNFFGMKFEIESVPKEITKERIEKWEKQGFELHYLPKMRMSEDANFPGWNVRYHREFFKSAEDGGLPSNAIDLQPGWILIDGRNKPNVIMKNNNYENDCFGEAIIKLKDEGVIDEESFKDYIREADIPDRSSRFCISIIELESEPVREAFAEVLGVKTLQIGLPRAIEFNVLANMHHPEWGSTDSYEKFSDGIWVVEGRGGRVEGGSSDRGGLKNVNKYPEDYRSRISGFRLLVRFDQQ